MIMNETTNKNPFGNNFCTPLHEAAYSGHLEICKLLLDGAENKNPADYIGNTPLHLAAKTGHLEVCKLIMSHVDVNDRYSLGLNIIRSADALTKYTPEISEFLTMLW